MNPTDSPARSATCCMVRFSSLRLERKQSTSRSGSSIFFSPALARSRIPSSVFACGSPRQLPFFACGSPDQRVVWGHLLLVAPKVGATKVGAKSRRLEAEALQGRFLVFVKSWATGPKMSTFFSVT